MMRWTPWTAMVAVVLLAVPARGQVRVEINPYAGALVFDDNDLEEQGLEIDVGPMIGVRLGVAFSERWQIEGGWGFVRSDIETSEFVDVPALDAGSDVDIHVFYGALNFFVLDPEVATKLLLSAGAGGVAVDPEGGLDTGTDFALNLGVGFTHPVNEWITFRGDVRDHLTFCSDDGDPTEFKACVGDATLNHIEISAGLEFWLN